MEDIVDKEFQNYVLISIENRDDRIEILSKEVD
jgi:hypothetical protein